jgi:hypothetical protein
MTTSHERGIIAEEAAANFLQNAFQSRFSKKSLQVGIKSDGRPALNNFDLVSEDRQIVAEVKAHRMTVSGNKPSGKIADTFKACGMLERVKANRKFLILADELFYKVFKQYSDGKIAKEIEIVHVPIPVVWDCVRPPKQVTRKETSKTLQEENAFNDFWAKLSSWLSSKQEIKNWTLKSGTIGEDFLAGPIIGNYVLVNAISAENTQRIPKNDFKLIFDNWDDYLDECISRGDLVKQSRFTKYTISIIHQFSNQEKYTGDNRPLKANDSF